MSKARQAMRSQLGRRVAQIGIAFLGLACVSEHRLGPRGRKRAPHCRTDERGMMASLWK